MALFTSPPTVTTPSSPFAIDQQGPPRFIGPYRQGGNIWAAGFKSTDTAAVVIKSTDAGASWAGSGTSPSTSDLSYNHGYLDVAFTPTTLHILGRRSATDMVYCAFDLGSGSYGSVIRSGLANGFWKIAIYNGNPIALFSKNVGGSSVSQPLQYSIISGGAFGTPVDLVALTTSRSYAPMDSILAADGTLHLLYTRFGGGTNQLWYVSLDSVGGISTPIQVDASAIGTIPERTGQGALWGTRLLWASNEGNKVVLYDGDLSSGPTWTKRTVTTPALSSQSNSFEAHVIVSGGVVYIWWYYVRFSSPLVSQVQYCTFDGTNFTAPQVAWDVQANHAPADPNDSEVQKFSVAANGTAWDLMAVEYVTAGYDAALVFLTNAVGGSSYINKMYIEPN